MGKLSNGVVGALTGKVGDMVYYVLNGENVARRIGKRVHAPSLAQLGNWRKLAMVTTFIRAFTEVVNVGFAEVGLLSNANAFNRAVSYNRMNAVIGVYPDFEMDFSRVLLSRGRLPGAVGASVAVVAGGLWFSWSVIDLPYPRENDQAVLLVYFPVLGSAIYALEGFCRSAGGALLPVSPELLAERMEVYMVFVAGDRKSVSDSVHLGGF